MRRFVLTGLVLLMAGAEAFGESFYVNDYLGNVYFCTINGLAVDGRSLDGRFRLGGTSRVENGMVVIRFHDGSSKTLWKRNLQLVTPETEPHVERMNYAVPFAPVAPAAPVATTQVYQTQSTITAQPVTSIPFVADPVVIDPIYGVPRLLQNQTAASSTPPLASLEARPIITSDMVTGPTNKKSYYAVDPVVYGYIAEPGGEVVVSPNYKFPSVPSAATQTQITPGVVQSQSAAGGAAVQTQTGPYGTVQTQSAPSGVTQYYYTYR